MKTQLIQLESHDDLISVRDRMGWAKTPRILLVWPRHGRVPLRPVDLAILKRHAVSLGAQLGLVTHVDEIRRVALELELPVFETLPEAQIESWEVGSERTLPQRRGPRPDLSAMREQAQANEAGWRSNPFVRIVFFALGVLAVLVLAAGFLPQASLSLNPVTRTQSVTIPVSAGPDIKSVFLSGSLPAREVSVSVSGTRSLVSSGTQSVPAGRAKGTVRFRNLTESTVNVPAGTIVRTLDSPPLRFETMTEAVLEARIGTTVDAPVQALDPGTDSNVEAGQIRAIEGDLGLQVSVSNSETLSGGSDQNLPAPNAADRVRLRTSLVDELKSEALSKLKASGEVVFDDTLKLAQVANETYEPAEGQPGSHLTLDMRVEFVAYAASQADLHELAARVLSASVQPGFSPQADTMDFKVLTQPKTGSDSLTRFDLRASQTIVQNLDVPQIVHLVQGRRTQIALAQLDTAVTLAAPPQLTMKPTWWPWLPLAPFRIVVVTP